MTTPHRFGRYMLRVGTGAALIILLFPSALFAANLNTLTSVSNAGIPITNGTTVYRSDFPSETTFWVFNFSWPNSVPNLRANFFLIRGTFGAVDGPPQEGVNYTTNNQAWAAGNSSIGKSFQFAPGGANLPSGTYTALVADTTSLSATMDWFASGGELGVEPVHYSTITFTYSASGRVEEVPGALQSVQYGARTILPGDTVYRKEVLPDQSNPSGFWRFVFLWPNAVSNLNTRFMVFKGTFGALSGGSPVEGVNYSTTNQSWAAGQNSIGKFMSFPVLEHAEPGTYTVLVAEKNTLGTTQNMAEWFASGGSAGVGPRRYSTLVFEYPKYEECCSSVVFLPGIKGSNLKIGNDTVWPPSLVSFSDDVAKLALTASGESVNAVTVEGVLNTFYGTPIYSGFTDFLTTLKNEATIHDWLPLAYDWRYGPEMILESGVVTSSGPLDILEEIETLAQNSRTGQVALVAHSMGGLLGKAIIKALEEEGKASLVDSFVMVGSPQLGTPQAVAGLLHGDDEGIGLGSLYYIVHPASSRSVSQNFQSAYNLLPSRTYFERVTEPTVSFDSNANFTELWRLYWGDDGINDYVGFVEFITGLGVVRDDPSVSLLRIPEILRADLVQAADDFHSEYDTYAFPAHIRVVQVAGWGVPTTKTVDYRNKHFLQNYQTQLTVEGDAAVLYPSAVASNGESYFFNLKDFRAAFLRSTQHRDLLNANKIQDVLFAVIAEQSVANIDFISSTKPNVATVGDQLAVSTHSPVVLGAHDAAGNGKSPQNQLESNP